MNFFALLPNPVEQLHHNLTQFNDQSVYTPFRKNLSALIIVLFTLQSVALLSGLYKETNVNCSSGSKQPLFILLRFCFAWLRQWIVSLGRRAVNGSFRWYGVVVSVVGDILVASSWWWDIANLTIGHPQSCGWSSMVTSSSNAVHFQPPMGNSMNFSTYLLESDEHCANVKLCRMFLEHFIEHTSSHKALPPADTTQYYYILWHFFSLCDVWNISKIRERIRWYYLVKLSLYQWSTLTKFPLFLLFL